LISSKKGKGAMGIKNKQTIGERQGKAGGPRQGRRAGACFVLLIRGATWPASLERREEKRRQTDTDRARDGDRHTHTQHIKTKHCKHLPLAALIDRVTSRERALVFHAFEARLLLLLLLRGLIIITITSFFLFFLLFFFFV